MRRAVGSKQKCVRTQTQLGSLGPPFQAQLVGEVSKVDGTLAAPDTRSPSVRF